MDRPRAASAWPPRGHRAHRMSAARGGPHVADWKPTICENVPDVEERTLRWAAQLGIEALALPGRLADPDGLGYWTEAGARAVADRLTPHGLKVGIMMLH